MKNKFRAISFLILLAIAFIYVSYNQKTEETNVSATTNEKAQEKAQIQSETKKEEVKAIEPKLQASQKKEIKKSSPKNEFLQGKLVASLAKDKAGFSVEEGAGVGITGVVFNQRGEALVVDRMNGEVSLIVDEHTTRNLLKLEDHQFLKGLGTTDNDEYLALVGDSSLDLIRFNAQGDKTNISLGIKPDHLNGMRVESLNDSVFIYGVEKTYEVGADGKVSEFYGTPLTSSTDGERRNIDVELAENGFVELTVRNKEGAPLETKVLTEAHGSIQGVYRINSNEVALVLESSPFTSEFNAQNPHYTVMRVNSDGEISSEVKIPRLSELSIDQPIEIKDGKIIQTQQTENEGLSIYQYDLP
jgi:hypothetical protein